MSLVQSFSIGGLTCHALDAGTQRLDGGAMFGVVPKPLWERRILADDRNRIQLALRCLLIEHEAGLILVDTGVGNKESEKFVAINGVENLSVEGRPTQLEDAIVRQGFTPDDIKYVINTHLHFDHAGGNTKIAEGQGGGGAEVAWHSGRVADGQTSDPGTRRSADLAFPNATYVVQRGELDFGRNRNERTAASYLPHNYEPVAAADRWQLIEGESELVPGIQVVPTPGHVPHHQSIIIERGGQIACFVGDLIPTAAHMSLPWIMGFDLEPLVTLETKRRLLARAAAEDWLLILEHEPGPAIGHVHLGEKGYRFEPLDTFRAQD